MTAAIVMIGGGGHAKVLLHILRSQQVTLAGYTDFAQQDTGELNYLGDDRTILTYGSDYVQLINGIGSIGKSKRRSETFTLWSGRGYHFLSVIHSAAIVASNVRHGEGLQLMAGAIVQPGCILGDNILINTRASVDHDCTIGDHVTISPGATVSGGVKIEKNAFVGAGATIIQGITIGENAVIGAGAVVLKDVKANSIVFGVPARERAES
jgi:sugar O-acyltransferase (sialic acid O-acetyltransferase NeuD family)